MINSNDTACMTIQRLNRHWKRTILLLVITCQFSLVLSPYLQYTMNERSDLTEMMCCEDKSNEKQEKVSEEDHKISTSQNLLSSLLANELANGFECSLMMTNHHVEVPTPPPEIALLGPLGC